MTSYGSVCSGIEAASVAWEPLGMSPLWFSEIEPFPCAVLAHRWPNVPNLGDMTQLPSLIRAGLVAVPDVLVGGTPCQAFSVAGRRGGMADSRGQLTLTYVDILNAIDEQRKPGDEAVCVWENVPGVLSSKDNAFGCFLAALCGENEELKPPRKKWANAGYVSGPQRTIAWRVIDAQYFGVAQRRRRVFVVASARDGFDPGAVLFEREGLRRDTAPSRETGAEIAGALASRTGAGGFPGTDEACNGYVRPWPAKVAATLNASFGDKQGLGDQHALGGASWFVPVGNELPTGVARSLTAAATGTGRLDPNEQQFVVHGTQDPCVGKGVAFTLGTNKGQENALCLPIHDKATRHAGKTGVGSANGLGVGGASDPSPTLTSADRHAVGYSGGVRRLTPTECERLQGFPDGHTDIPWRHKAPYGCPDSPRYKAIGNSKAVPCVQWLGKRLLKQLDVTGNSAL